MDLFYNNQHTNKVTNYKNIVFFFKLQLLLAYYYKFFWKLSLQKIALEKSSLQVCIYFLISFCPGYLHLLTKKPNNNVIKSKSKGLYKNPINSNTTNLQTFPLLKSPFIYKKAYRHYAYSTYSCLLTTTIPIQFIFWLRSKKLQKLELYNFFTTSQLSSTEKLFLR